MTTTDDELSPRERDLLKSLPRELDPPDSVRVRVREELFRRGVLRPRPERPRAGGRALRWAVAAAVLAGVFLAGTIVGSWWSGTPVGIQVAVPPEPGSRTVDGALVQAVGSEYASVIQTLAEDPQASRDALTAALATLRAAAEKMSEAPGLAPETVSLLRRVREQGLYPEERTGVL